MSLFSVPIMQVPTGLRLKAPRTLPVVYEEEEVAHAQFREGSYDFLLFSGNLFEGLKRGRLLLKPRHVDKTDPDGTITREYLAVEIVHEENFDIHRTES